jgi:chloride channel 2
LSLVCISLSLLYISLILEPTGATQTLSTAVIIFEITGQLRMLYPAVAAVVIAVQISRMLSVSVYDQMLKDKRLPYLAQLEPEKYAISAREVMSTHVPILYKKVGS